MPRAWKHTDHHHKDFKDALILAGMFALSQSTKLSVAVIRCPNCQEPVEGLDGAEQLYKVVVGKTKIDVPPCPVSGLDLPTMTYTVAPCGCRVSSEWAGAFTCEKNRREDGEPPQPVVGLSRKQRDERVKFYQGKLQALYALQAATNPPETREAIDTWIVIVADQIQRLCPGTHNTAVKPLTPKVQEWADANAFAVPKFEVTPPADKETTGDATAAYLSLLQQTTMQKNSKLPEVVQTRNKQWSVRLGDIYKVFVTKPEADDYAAQLANVTAGFAETMSKPPEVRGDVPLGQRLAIQLKYRDPASLPSQLLADVLSYTYSHLGFCENVADVAFGAHGRLLTRAEILQDVRDDLAEHLNGVRVTGASVVFSVTTDRFIRKLAEMLGNSPQAMAGPQTGVPEKLTGPTAKHAKRKRTIRRLDPDTE